MNYFTQMLIGKFFDLLLPVALAAIAALSFSAIFCIAVLLA
jgi:hypothetical protein